MILCFTKLIENGKALAHVTFLITNIAFIYCFVNKIT